MKLKKGLLLLCMAVLCGCGTKSESSTPSTNSPQGESKSIYEGLDGLQTYQKAVKYFNDHVTYFQEDIIDGDNHSQNEYYLIDGAVSVVEKMLYQDNGYENLTYTIRNGKDFHSLFINGDGTYTYELMDNSTHLREQMFLDCSRLDDYQFIDVQRQDSGDQIILTMKLSRKESYQTSDDTYTVYYMSEMTIQKSGYITQEKITYYTNDQFNDIDYDGETIQYSLFNEKNQAGLNEEIDMMKSCDGLMDSEVKEKLAL